MSKIAIIGAGLAGTLGGYFLAKRGHNVTIYDRESISAMACSKANGGQVSVCNAETWNTWKNVGKGIKWMFQADAPLLINPTPSLAKIKWLAGFMRHTLNGSHIKNTIETISLGNTSKLLYENIIEEEGLKFDRLKTGLLHVYTNEQSFNTALYMRDIFEGHGVEYRSVQVSEILNIDKSLVNFKSIIGGIMTGNDWTGDPHLFCNALTKVMQEKYGVMVEYNAEVTAVKPGKVYYLYKKCAMSHINVIHGGYDHIVLSNGHEITKFASKFGDSMNVYPVKGYSITIDNVGAEAPSVSLLDDDKKIVTSRLGNRLRVAGTAELADVNFDIRQVRIDPLVKWVNDNFPSVDTSSYTPWACLRPMNSNMMPIVRESKTKGIWYHGAHGHLGWTLSPSTGLMLTELIGNE